MAQPSDILDPDQLQVVTDIETLSTQSNAAIVSIGATKFTLNEGIIETFKVNVDAIDCRDKGLHIDKDTIEWWKKQPKEVSDRWKIDPQPLKTALSKFVEWYGPKSLPTHAKGPDFDLIILRHAMAMCGMATPWRYYDVVCVRTIMKLAGYVKPKEEIVHDALDDAIDQTKTIIEILKS